MQQVTGMADGSPAVHDVARRLYLAGFESMLERRDNIAMAAYAEALVVASLPSSQPGTSRWDFADVRWRGWTFQVKSSTAYAEGRDPERTPHPARWAAPVRYALDENIAWVDEEHPRRHTDFYVFARHDGLDPKTGWSIRPVPTVWLDANLSAQGGVSASTLDSAGWGRVDFDALPAWVERQAVPPSRSDPGIPDPPPPIERAP
jgi:hypothetical protein